MIVLSSVNYWAVLVAGLVYFAVGGLWYSKGLFGKAWMKCVGITEESAKGGGTALKMTWAFIGSLLTAYGIARLLSLMQTPTALGGLLIGLLIGINFEFVNVSVGNAMEGRPFKLTLINALYNIVGFLIMGLIIGGWR